MQVETKELPGHTLSLLITPHRINRRVDQMGKKLAKEFLGRTPVMLAILDGGLSFHNKITASAQLYGLAFSTGSFGVKSYGDKTESSRAPRITQDLDVDITDQDVNVNEDIIDSGISMEFALKYLWQFNPRSITVTSLLRKPEREVIQIPTRDVGFDIPNKFAVGEGIDYAQRYRTLAGIWVVNFLAS